MNVRVQTSNKSTADSPVKPSAPAEPARTVLAVPDKPVRGQKEVLRDESAAVVAQHRYPRERIPVNSDRIVVIGAGFGGLAAAIRLRAMGYPVLLLESGSQAGGRARWFERDGFRFDAGPTVITAPYLFDELFALVGRDPRDYYQLLAVEPYYRVLFSDGCSFDYSGDEERLLQQIEKLNPKDVDGYRKLAKLVERIFDIGYTRLADQPFERLSDMARIVPDMIRLSGYRSVYGLVSRYLKDPRLR